MAEFVGGEPISVGVDEPITFENKTYKDRDLIRATRCKDCEYCHPYYCEAWITFGTMQTREDGYCYKYKAVREEDGAE